MVHVLVFQFLNGFSHINNAKCIAILLEFQFLNGFSQGGIKMSSEFLEELFQFLNGFSPDSIYYLAHLLVHKFQFLNGFSLYTVKVTVMRESKVSIP